MTTTRAHRRRVVVDAYSDPGRPYLVGVLDANAILSSLENQCRTGNTARLVAMAECSAFRLYSADHVWHEVYEKLPKLAALGSASVEDLREVFETRYLPNVRFVTMSAPTLDDEALDVSDLDDRPLARLARLLAPCVVFSEDKHLRKPGLGPPPWWGISKHGGDLAYANNDEHVLGTTLVLPFYGVGAAAKFVLRRTGTPPLVFGMLLIGGLGLWLGRPQRRGEAWQLLEVLGDRLGRELLRIENAVADALDGLRPYIFARSGELSPRDAVAIVLARTEVPMLVRELRAEVGHLAPQLAHLREHDLRAIVESGSEFVHPRGERYRWQLGRLVGVLIEA